MTNEIKEMAQAFFERHSEITNRIKQLCSDMKDLGLINSIILEEEVGDFQEACYQIEGFSKMAEDHIKYGTKMIVLLQTGCQLDEVPIIEEDLEEDNYEE